jgi:hypothetical protein
VTMTIDAYTVRRRRVYTNLEAVYTSQA